MFLTIITPSQPFLDEIRGHIEIEGVYDGATSPSVVYFPSEFSSSRPFSDFKMIINTVCLKPIFFALASILTSFFQDFTNLKREGKVIEIYIGNSDWSECTFEVTTNYFYNGTIGVEHYPIQLQEANFGTVDGLKIQVNANVVTTGQEYDFAGVKFERLFFLGLHFCCFRIFCLPPSDSNQWKLKPPRREC